jgi:hypothetical protein
VAGPFLVLRVQSDAFSKLPYEERKQALRTLCALRPRRAEEICIKLLSESKLLRSRRLEETRELAAMFLAEVASTNPALYLLEEVSTSKWWHSSSRVRDAAAAALKRLEERAGQAVEDASKTAAGTKAGTKAPRQKTAAGAVKPAGKQSAAGTAAGAGPRQARSR